MYNNKNFRVMKFFESTREFKNAKGFVKIDLRGNRGQISVNIEGLSNNIEDKAEVFLYKNKEEKIKIGPISAKKGNLQRALVLNGRDDSIEKYCVCGVMYGNKVVMYAQVFLEENKDVIKQLVSKFDDIMLNENKIQEKNQRVEDCKLNLNSLVNKSSENSIVYDNTEEISNGYKIGKDIRKEKKEYERREGEQIAKLQDKVEQNIDNYEEAKCENIGKLNEFSKIENKINGEKNYKNDYERRLFLLLNEFERIDPLLQEIKGLTWWKIDYDDGSIYKGFLPYFNQIISTYYPFPIFNHVTTCQALMKNHGHYLFGIYEENSEVTKYVYGVPGKFSKEEQPYRGATGFKNWSYKSDKILGDFGYWIAFVDANTGNLTEPPKI